MAQFNKLSDREWEVLELLLQGKSNKQIAASLNISVHTVEFHLKNIYAKLGVSTRIELILKLGNTTGISEIHKLRRSIVDRKRKLADNRDRLNSSVSWFQNIASIIGQELKMKNLSLSKHVPVGLITTLFTGFMWVAVLTYQERWLITNDFRRWAVPLIIIWATIGLAIGLIGKRSGSSLHRVFFSALLGTGLSPFLIMPLMFIIVLPLAKVAQWLGLIDPSIMSNAVAELLVMASVTAIWLIVGLTIGTVLLFVTIRKPVSSMAQQHAAENSS